MRGGCEGCRYDMVILEMILTRGFLDLGVLAQARSSVEEAAIIRDT